MTTSGAWWEAVWVHAALSSGHVLRAVPVSAPVAGLGAEHGEYAVGVFAHSGGAIDRAPMSYACYRAATELAGVLIKEGLCAEVTEALSSGYTGLIPTGTFSNAR